MVMDMVLVASYALPIVVKSTSRSVRYLMQKCY